MSWMTNIRDWCISRQLWWGHRIPVWYCRDCDHVTVSREDPSACAGCGGGSIHQDEDVLDTWFSSWLWTFSPLGWPDETRDLERYHPTSVLVTAPEIIFFWVARMIMASLEFMGEVPFRHVFLTGIVRDGKGRKMSKSLGNSPDPLDIIQRFGTDAFRFTLAMLSPPGRDVFFDESKIEMGRNFVNKVWQATRMVTSQLDDAEPLWRDGDGAGGDSAFAAAWRRAHGSALAFEPSLQWEDEWILGALSACASDTDGAWRDWRLNDGTSRIYDFFWHDYCDWYLELAKIRLYEGGDARTVKAVLLYVLGESMKLLHPLMPYVSEEIWHKLPMTKDLLLRNPYPSDQALPPEPDVEARMELFRAVVTAARNIRAEYHVNPGSRIPLRIMTPEGDDAARDAIEAGREGIVQLARVDRLEIGPHVVKEKGSAATPIGDIEVIVPLAGVVDLEEEYLRLGREKEKIEKELDQVGRKLSNDKFVSRANPEVVEKERDKQERLRAELAKLVESMSIIKAD
jgi:valyl-tRNA synthetase